MGTRPASSALRGALVLCHFVCPLLFFTDLTRNPYITQIALLNIGVLTAVAACCLAQSAEGCWRLPRTPIDAPLVAWLAVCGFTWLWAYFHHAPFFRGAIRSEGLRVMAFTWVNAALPFCLSALCVPRPQAEPELPLGRWAAFAAAWGGAWLLFPALRTASAPAMRIWPHVWDAYGGLLWAAGAAAAAALAWRGTLHHFWHLALVVGLLSSCYSVFQYFGIEFIWPKVLNPYGGRSVSTFGNPNFMSSYMVVLLPVAAAYYLKARSGAARAAYGICLLALEAALLCSLTRSSWAGALVALAVLPLSGELRRRARENLQSHGLVVSAAALMLLFWPRSVVAGYTPSVFGRLAELASAWNPEPGGPYSPLYQRVLIWACAWMMGDENPLWGKGWGLFELFYPFYQGHLVSQVELFRTLRTHANNAHNELLEVWAQTGLLGVGTTLWLWASFFTAAWRWRAASEGAAASSPESAWRIAAVAGVAGMLVDNLLNVSLHFAVPAFWFWWQVGAAVGPLSGVPAPSRSLRFTRPAPAAAAVACVAAACLAGSWWWVMQWNREVRYFMGFKLLRSNRLGAAVEALEAAHRWHGREVNANYELGNAYARSELHAKAAWAYEEALRANAGYDEIYFNLGTVLFQRLGRPEEALRNYRLSLAINPLSFELYNNLSAFYLRDPARYGADCVALLERALRFFPDQPSFLNNLGYLYRLERRYPAAEEVLSRALRLDPEFALAERNLRELAAAAGRPPHPALRELDAYRELGSRVARRDYSPATLELARKAAAAFPKSQKASFYLGNLEFMHGRPAEALKLLEPLAAADPRNAPLQKNLGEIYLRLGRARDAERAWRAALAADPSDAYARRMLAVPGSSSPRP